MKNKKTLWILVPAVLAIWGMIGWKVYAAMQNPDEEYVELPLTESDVDSSFVPENYELDLNYRDPFLGEQIRTTPVRQSSENGTSNKNISKPELTPPIQAPVLHYYGLVQETSTGKTVGFLRINSETHFVKAKDVIEGVTVLRIWSDSVEVSFGNLKSVVRK